METITPAIDFSTELAGLFELEGQVAYIPGGYGGIGEAIAWALAMHGATVVVAGRNPDSAEKLAASLGAAGHRASGLALDVHSVSEIESSTDAVMDLHRRLDILVNCIGIQREEPLLEVTEAAFDDVYQTNLKAAMFLAQAAARHQVKCGRGGRQVHLLSVRSQLGLRARGYSAYCTAAPKGDWSC